LNTAPSSAGDRNQECDPIGKAEIDGEYDHQIRRDHRELALSEIDDAGGAKDQHEAERNQRVNRAYPDPAEKQLREEIHTEALF
jgi:hypothetical protein